MTPTELARYREAVAAATFAARLLAEHNPGEVLRAAYEAVERGERLPSSELELLRSAEPLANLGRS